MKPPILAKILRYARYEISDFRLALQYWASYRKSPLNLSAWRKGFAAHSRGPDTADRQIAARLLNAYHKAKQDEAQAPDVYRRRGEWENIIRVEYARLLRSLDAGDVEGLAALLSNFCRNE